MNGQSFDLFPPPDSSELTMQMLPRMVWISLIVVIGFVVELFGPRQTKPLLCLYASYICDLLCGRGRSAETPGSCQIAAQDRS
jgi:hypothetical protein